MRISSELTISSRAVPYFCQLYMLHHLMHPRTRRWLLMTRHMPWGRGRRRPSRDGVPARPPARPYCG
ncbi:hypothetical protein SCOCK_580047 [Actinacidiphila cocklensis]|uniref:Uncharacterized protein n=1 Tax=Actinacidiphila cocklensis TaxID=887465 RepID=A0A9W4DYB1_9ACTN|nr:hypothetical protein SCOCK_580047 [Actinacidiphila cocklensis]